MSNQLVFEYFVIKMIWINFDLKIVNANLIIKNNLRRNL